MNSVILIGRLTRDPELTYTPNTQTAKTTFTIAVDRPKRNGDDQGADFIRVVVWGKQAESCGRYLGKGRQVAVLGSIVTGSYTNRDGVKVYTTDVTANRVEFLGDRRQEEHRQDEFERTETFDTVATSFYDMPDSFASAQDDIPF